MVKLGERVVKENMNTFKLPLDLMRAVPFAEGQAD